MNLIMLVFGYVKALFGKIRFIEFERNVPFDKYVRALFGKIRVIEFERNVRKQ